MSGESFVKEETQEDYDDLSIPRYLVSIIVVIVFFPVGN